MGVFSRKDSAAATVAQDPHKPHDYKAPAQPPSSGHEACQVCGRAPNDVLHEAEKSGAIDSEIHWS